MSNNGEFHENWCSEIHTWVHKSHYRHFLSDSGEIMYKKSANNDVQLLDMSFMRGKGIAYFSYGRTWNHIYACAVKIHDRK